VNVGEADGSRARLVGVQDQPRTWLQAGSHRAARQSC
jgi:hypothetical protein